MKIPRERTLTFVKALQIEARNVLENCSARSLTKRVHHARTAFPSWAMPANSYRRRLWNAAIKKRLGLERIPAGRPANMGGGVKSK